MSYREARTKHDKFKLITYMQYIQQSWREKKEKNKKKSNVYQLHSVLPVWSWIPTANKLKQRACSLILNLAVFLCPRQLRKSFQVAYFSVVQICNNMFLLSKRRWVIQNGEVRRMLRQCHCLPATSVWLLLHATFSLLQIFSIWLSWVNIWGRV